MDGRCSWLKGHEGNFRYVGISGDGKLVAGSEHNAPKTILWKVGKDRDTDASWAIESPEGGDIAFGKHGVSQILVTSEHARYRVWKVGSEQGPVHAFDVKRPSGYQKSAASFSQGMGWILSIDRSTIQVADPLQGSELLSLRDGYQSGRIVAVRGSDSGIVASAFSNEGFVVWDTRKIGEFLVRFGLR